MKRLSILNHKKTQVFFSYYILLFILLKSFSVNAQAQYYTDLILLKGFNTKVYYSNGHEERAKTIANLCQKAIDYNSKLLGSKPEVTLLILNHEDWKKYTSFPVYGMAHYTDQNTLIVASSDNDFWKSFIPAAEKLKPVIINTYTNSLGTLSMQPFFDLLVLHELGHAFHMQGGLNMQRKWMGELFCNILLHTYIAENEPDLLAALTVFPEMVVAEGTNGFTYTNLIDFESKYEELGTKMPNNYGWYQCRLHKAAKNIYEASGTKGLQQLWIALQKQRQPLSDVEFADLLYEKVHPSVADVLINWDRN